MTEAIRKAVALLPSIAEELGPKDGPQYPVTLNIAETRTLIAALEDMQGVADGTHVVVPMNYLKAIIEADQKKVSVFVGVCERGDIYEHRWCDGDGAAVARSLISKAQEK
jgi:hypothetical protein